MQHKAIKEKETKKEQEKEKEEDEFINKLFNEYLKSYKDCEYYVFSLNLSLVKHKRLDLGTCTHPQNKKMKNCNFNLCPIFQDKLFQKLGNYYYVEFFADEDEEEDNDD